MLVATSQLEVVSVHYQAQGHMDSVQHAEIVDTHPGRGRLRASEPLVGWFAPQPSFVAEAADASLDPWEHYRLRKTQ
jgi:hypothetical protein